jgi:hypothetical protein
MYSKQNIVNVCYKENELLQHKYVTYENNIRLDRKDM